MKGNDFIEVVVGPQTGAAEAEKITDATDIEAGHPVAEVTLLQETVFRK